MPTFIVYEFDSSTCVVRDEDAEWAICSAFEGQSEFHTRRAERICGLLNNAYRGVALDSIDGLTPQGIGGRDGLPHGRESGVGQ